MMKIKELNPGDKVILKTSEKQWQGTILESHDSEVILLKLESGYNIGIKESQILNVKVIEKSKPTEKKQIKLEKNKTLPDIALIITGGTISSRLDPKTGGVIPTDADEILKLAPEISEVANIAVIEKPIMKFSENMSYKDWKILAETCEKLLNQENIRGIIITHGTDFLHYTSSALSFFIKKLNKPIALTYSQRSIDRGSTDANLNLLCAAKYAISDIAEVALIGHKDLNDLSCIAMTGTKVRKMHTSRRDTFKPINSEPLAEISKTEFKILKNFNARSNQKPELDLKFNENTALIKIYPGQNPDILDFYEKQGYKGLILEVAGLGQIPTQDGKFNWLPKLKKLIDKGITVCAAPQTIYGRLNPNVYSAGRDIEKTGVIYLEDILPETALIKLSWVLGHPKWIKDKLIKEKMLHNFANEFNDKLGFEF